MISVIDEKKKEMEVEIKLQINKRLFKKGIITEEMYKTARNIILNNSR